MESKKIYVASSWKNEIQPRIVAMLREWGHIVYDFKQDNGFAWSDIDPAYKDWSPSDFTTVLQSDPYCKQGFSEDMTALVNCDICVLVLPCNRSSHLELGFAVGQMKGTLIILDEDFQPELMYAMCHAVVDSSEPEAIKGALEYIIKECLINDNT